jgi:hypothetical protein
LIQYYRENTIKFNDAHYFFRDLVSRNNDLNAVIMIYLNSPLIILTNKNVAEKYYNIMEDYYEKIPFIKFHPMVVKSGIIFSNK